jgi:hypothetical protein
MQIRGIVQSAELREESPGSDRIEMVLWVQGVGPNKPRHVVVPFELLLSDQSLDADRVRGHGFQAEVEEEGPGRWVVLEIGFASGRVLRNEGS